MSDEGKLIYEKVGNVAQITFDNQKAYNALTWNMWRQLGEYCTEIAKDDSVRVVTFRGAGGKAFISGTDITGFRSFEGGQRGVDYEKEMDGYIGSVEALPQPTVAIVEGWAVGGGLAISFACDFRIARAGSKWGSPLGRTIGNCLSMKGYTRAVALAGVAQVKRMILLGEMPTAEEMKALGLVLEVVEQEDLEKTVADVVERLAGMAPLTIKATKEAIRRLTYANQPNIEDLISMVYGSEDFKSGVNAFLDKQPKPDWKGR